MNENKKAEVLNFNVTDELSVQVIPEPIHEFIMPTKEVALGFGCTPSTIRKQMERYSSELVPGKHYIKGVNICHTVGKKQPHKVYWTKRGIVRLGFFIKSKQASIFRDWAEDLVLNKLENTPDTGQPELYTRVAVKQAMLVNLHGTQAKAASHTGVPAGYFSQLSRGRHLNAPKLLEIEEMLDRALGHIKLRPPVNKAKVASLNKLLNEYLSFVVPRQKPVIKGMVEDILEEVGIETWEGRL